MYTNNSRTNAMRPLSSRPESQSLKNIIGLFSHASAKPQPILNELPREFGKDITNSKGLTEISNEDNIKKITVNKKNHVYIDLCGDVNMKDIKEEDVVMQEVNDRSDPQEVDEYFEDIVEYFREEDGKKRPRENYMDRQGDITYKMRAILVDWLVDVHLKYKMVPETLFLTINIIDRYLDKVNTPRTSFSSWVSPRCSSRVNMRTFTLLRQRNSRISQIRPLRRVKCSQWRKKYYEHWNLK